MLDQSAARIWASVTPSVSGERVADQIDRLIAS